MVSRVCRIALLLGSAMSLAGCHTVAGDGLRPAVLVADGPAARAEITRTLLAVTRDGRVSFGESDLTRAPLIVVQPPPPAPFEGNSPAMPTYFELVTDGSACFLRRRADGSGPTTEPRQLHRLEGVRCRPR